MWADHSIGTGEEAGVKLLQGALPRISPLSPGAVVPEVCENTLACHVSCLPSLLFVVLTAGSCTVERRPKLENVRQQGRAEPPQAAQCRQQLRL